MILAWVIIGLLFFAGITAVVLVWRDLRSLPLVPESLPCPGCGTELPAWGPWPCIKCRLDDYKKICLAEEAARLKKRSAMIVAAVDSAWERREA